MSYEVRKCLDMSRQDTKSKFDQIISEWRRECIRKVASRKSLRKGGRTLRREMQRAGMKINDTEGEDIMIYEFVAKGRTVSILYIHLENDEVTA